LKAIVCTKYGPPEVLQLREVETPEPAKDEILIKVYATTVTVADVRCRAFRVPPSYWIPARLALGLRRPRKSVLGVEFAGAVESTGSEVHRFKAGDQVFGSMELDFGAYAGYVCIPEVSQKTLVSLKPRNLSLQEAAAVPLGARTALYFLQEAHIKQGQDVLINGASGSVGTYAVQLAKYFGTNVSGVCSTANVALVASLGADTVIDYTKQDFTRLGKKYDVIFETVGKSTFAGCIQSLKDKGVLLHAVATPDISARMRWVSMTSRKKMVGGGPAVKIEELEFLKDLIEEGRIRPVIDRTYPFEQIVAAHRYVDEGHKRGNVVITMAVEDHLP